MYLPSMPDYDNVIRRRKTVHSAYTYDELCEKRSKYGDKAFYKYWMTQWYAWKRQEGWEGDEPENATYFDLLTDAELYVHSRRFLPNCVCMTCAYCDSIKFWRWVDKNNPCLEGMNEAQLSEIKTAKSPKGRFDLITQCPLYEKKDDRQIYYAYIESPLWREIRRLIIDASPYCEGCGRGEGENGVHLVVHHKNYEHLCFEDETNDCAVLCNECHTELHRDPEAYWDKHSVIIPAHKKEE